MKNKAQVWIAASSGKAAPQILLLKVLPSRGDGWHPITGSVEKKETPFEGAIRETIEETGIELNASHCRWFDLNYSFQFKGRWGEVEEHAFGLLIPAIIRVELDPKEHTEAKWVGIAEALKTVKFPNQKKALELFYAKLVDEKLF